MLSQFEINLLMGCISVMAVLIASITGWMINRATKTVDLMQSQLTSVNLQLAALPGQYIPRPELEGKLEKIFEAIAQLSRDIHLARG